MEEVTPNLKPGNEKINVNHVCIMSVEQEPTVQ